MFSKTELVIGSTNLNKLQNINVIIFGLGGVGGYVAEMFLRLGVQNLTVADFDTVDKTNINRQILALESTINQKKVDVFEERAKQINKRSKITKFNLKLSKDNVKEFFKIKYDYVIDAIDDVNAKIALAKYCYENDIKIISSMGTGNRFKDVPTFEICDIFKTSYDALAKKIRKLLKEEQVKKLTVVYTKQQPEKTEKLGSVVYYPLMCAGTIVSYVVNELVK